MIEETTENIRRLWIAFVDFRKAFDTVDIGAILKSLRNATVDGYK